MARAQECGKRDPQEEIQKIQSEERNLGRRTLQEQIELLKDKLLKKEEETNIMKKERGAEVARMEKEIERLQRDMRRELEELRKKMEGEKAEAVKTAERRMRETFLHGNDAKGELERMEQEKSVRRMLEEVRKENEGLKADVKEMKEELMRLKGFRTEHVGQKDLEIKKDGDKMSAREAIKEDEEGVKMTAREAIKDDGEGVKMSAREAIKEDEEGVKKLQGEATVGNLSVKVPPLVSGHRMQACGPIVAATHQK